MVDRPRSRHRSAGNQRPRNRFSGESGEGCRSPSSSSSRSCRRARLRDRPRVDTIIGAAVGAGLPDISPSSARRGVSASHHQIAGCLRAMNRQQPWSEAATSAWEERARRKRTDSSGRRRRRPGAGGPMELPRPPQRPGPVRGWHAAGTVGARRGGDRRDLDRAAAEVDPHRRRRSAISKRWPTQSTKACS
jgi:hypothetical protein